MLQEKLQKEGSKKERKNINGETYLCFLTAENFSETMCFKKLKQKKKI